jgi:urea transport system ATP-binding protein
MTRHGSIVYLEGVSVTFDGFQALRGVNLYVERGELRALIGPNGAGKTTLIDVICGQVKPDTGRVIFGDATDLSMLQPHQIAALGIGGKFQTPSVFKRLTLLENLALSLPQRWDLCSTLFGAPTTAQLEKMESILEALGLLEKAHHRAGSLSHGEVQWLAISMVMA